MLGQANTGRFRSLVLLGALILVILSVPMEDSLIHGRTIVGLFYIAVFCVGGALLASGRSWVIAYLCVAVPYLLLGLVSTADAGGVGVRLAKDFLGLALQLMLMHAVVKFSLFDPRAEAIDRIIAGICGYLVLGLLWENLYAIHETISPGGFVRSDGTAVPADGVSLTYYSFVTLSTLGYGDISPRGPWAQMMAAMQAVAGTLYLTVFVASLVAGLKRSEARNAVP